MKRLFALLTLACASAACQPQAAQITTATISPKETVAIAQPASPVSATQPNPATLADSLTPEMRTTLQRVDLGSLWKEAGVLDGFFGRDPQRLSLVILQAARDSLKPGLFHVTGKTRYRKQVANFSGNLQITSVADYYDQGRLLTQSDDTFVQDTSAAGNGAILNARAYSASAAFTFSSKPPASYALTGRAALDFWVTDKGKIGILSAPCEGCTDEKVPSKGSALLLCGKWLHASTKRQQSFVVCRDVFFISNDLIANFGIGDRGAQVNPKYAKLGWTDYWENDEWWADSPKPSLNL